MLLICCFCTRSVKVNFEDKQSTGATSVVMDVNPNATCLAMKKLVSEFVVIDVINF